MDKVMPVRYYVIVRGPTEGMALHHYLKEANVPQNIAPAPRLPNFKMPCGMALRVEEADYEALLAALQGHEDEYVTIVKVGDQKGGSV